MAKKKAPKADGFRIPKAAPPQAVAVVGHEEDEDVVSPDPISVEATPPPPPSTPVADPTPELHGDESDVNVAPAYVLKRYRVTAGKIVFWQSQRINLHTGKVFTEATFTPRALKAFYAAGLKTEEIK